MASAEEMPSVSEPVPSAPEPTDVLSQDEQPTPVSSKTSAPPKRPIGVATKAGPTKTASFMKPTSTATARSTPGSTLNKPPARPTSTSAAKKSTLGTSTSSPLVGHKSHQSVASTADEAPPGASGDERKKTGISGPAKRMSLAGSTASSRIVAKGIIATPDRRSTIQASLSSERRTAGQPAISSPTKSRGTVTKPTAAKSVAATPGRSITKPTTSSLRGTGALDVKKRLSTIPASPAVKIGVIMSEDDKENTEADTASLKPTRPLLGQRQSTRSAVLQQRLREFELVHEMLQAAIAADDKGDEENTEVMEEVDVTMSRVKDDLAKIRAFEKKHGRTPTADELSAESGVEQDVAPVAVEIVKGGDDETAGLKQKLEESEERVEALIKEIAGMQLKMEQFGESAAEEAANVQSASEALQTEHAAKIASLQAEHAGELANLQSQIQELESQQQAHAEKALEDLEAAKVAAAAAGDTKTENLLQEQKIAHETALKEMEQQLTSHKEELAKTKLLIEDHAEAVKKHQAQLASSDRELNGQTAVIKSLQDELASMNSKIQGHEAAAAQTSQDRADHEKALASRDQEIKNLSAVIERLQDEIRTSHERQSDEYDAKLFQIRQEHEQIIATMKSHHQSSVETLQDTHAQIMQKLASESQKTRETHQREMQTAKEELLWSSEKELDSVQTALDTAKKESEALSAKLRAEALASSEQADSRIKSLQEKIEFLEVQAAKDGTALKAALGDLEATRSQITSLQQVLETFEKDRVTKDKHHENMLKKAKAEAEEAAKGLADQKSSLEAAGKAHAKALQDLKSNHAAEIERLQNVVTTKHETALSELQAKHDETLAKVNQHLEAAHKEKIEELQAQHQSALSDSTKMIADLQVQHFNEIQETNDQLGARHSEALAALEEKHSKQSQELLQQHQLALDGLHATQEKALLDLRSNMESRHVAELAKLSEAPRDTRELDALNTELTEMKRDHATAQEALAQLKKDHVSTQENLAQLKKDYATAQETSSKATNDVKMLNTQLAKDQESIVKLTSTAEDASKMMAEINKETDSLRESLKEATEGANAADASLKGVLQKADTQRTLNDTLIKELDALKAASKVQGADHESAKAKLLAAEEAAEKSNMKIQELEASLKVTKAELAEAKTVMADGADFPQSPPSKANGSTEGDPGLGKSKWATTAGTEMPAGEEGNIAIQGKMASIQEQLRQLDEVNAEFLDDHARMARTLSDIPPPDSPSATTSSRPTTSGAID